VISILVDHIRGSFVGLGRDVVILSGFEEAADAILSLPALSVPEGWVAVPREVVEPFIEAVESADDDRVGDHINSWESPVAMELTHGDFRRLHEAALSAPSPRASCAYCGAVRAKPCNDMLCPWAPQ
jgi:hypothetical protein